MEFVEGTCLSEVSHPELLTVLLFRVMGTLPGLVTAGILYAIFWQDIHTLCVGLGVVVNLLLVYFAKEVLRVDRPVPDCPHNPPGHAFPSMHATLAVFLASYYIYCFWRYGRSHWAPRRLWMRIVTAASFAALVCLSRPILGFNTGHATWSGALMGFLSSLLFVYLMQKSKATLYFLKEE